MSVHSSISAFDARHTVVQINMLSQFNAQKVGVLCRHGTAAQCCSALTTHRASSTVCVQCHIKHYLAESTDVTGNMPLHVDRVHLTLNKQHVA
jgi:uncharacterized paraquat-inducible protein A